MVQLESVLKVCDNTGANALKVITLFGRKRFARLGDVVSGSVRGVSGRATVADHSVVHAVVVRTRKENRRADGSYTRFDDNACVLVDKNGHPIGTRVFGPVAREVREGGFPEVAAMALEVV